MTYLAGVFLGLVAGFGVATILARKASGPVPIGRGRIALATVAATVLVAGSIALARRDHGRGAPQPVVAATTSTVAPAPVPTTPVTEPHAIVSVPNLVGTTRAAALATLRNLALIPNVQTLPTSSVPPGYVLSQNPVTQSLVTEGSTVSLVLSAAP